jgi:hypothetical protein
MNAYLVSSLMVSSTSSFAPSLLPAFFIVELRVLALSFFL